MASTFSGKLYDRRFMGKYNNLSSVYADILPNDIKEVIQWSEFIVANVPLVASAIDKMSSVAITSLQYMTDDLSEMSVADSRSWKNILEDKMDIVSVLQEAGFNYLLDGNAFISVFFPMHRTVTCTKCKESLSEKDFSSSDNLKPSVEQITHVVDNKGKKKKATNREALVMKGRCPKCNTSGSIFTIKDIPVNDMSGVNIITWPVMNMSFVHDSITGRTTFYYKMANSERKMITDGFLDMLFHKPIDILEAAVKNTVVKFDDGKILHLKRKKMSGTNSGWGMPILTSAIPEMISLLLLRKSQERILSDMIFPLRGLTPRATGTDGNAVYNYMSGSDVSKKVENILRGHKANPTAVKFFPMPLDPITAFGEGKSLNLSEEIDQISTMIMTSIGVPIEFVKGGLGYTAAGASIRILENQLMGLTRSMEKIANFVAKQIAVYKNKKDVAIKITPFRIIDDIAEKQILLSLYQQQKLSDHTMASMFKLDAKMENDKMLEEHKLGVKAQFDIQEYQRQIAQNLEEKAKTEAMLSQSSTQQVNQQAIMQEADQMAAQLQQMEAGQRKSEMDRLQKENWLLYVATKERMEFNAQKDATAAAQQARQEQNPPQGM
jgi:hypothetical protein